MTTQLTNGQKVEITDNYSYARFVKGLTGIVVKYPAGEGVNVWLNVNGAGRYEDMIFWFPIDCVKTIN